MWQSLFANIAVAAIVLAAWTAIGDWTLRLHAISRKLLFGGVMAAGTLGSMTMAFQPAPGIFLDFRVPLIVVTCLFGGVPAAAVVTIPALLYRVALGGEVMVGVMAILVAVAIGLSGAWLHARRPVRFIDLVALGVAAAASGATFSYVIARTGPDDLATWQVAVVILTGGATLLFGVPLLLEERRRALSVSNGLYQSMVDALPDCLNVKDLDGRFLAANPATAVLMRTPSRDDLIGKTDFDFYPRDLADRFRQDELAILRDQRHQTIEQPGLRPDGSKGWLSTLKAPLRDEAGQVIGLITHNRDITDRVELQADLWAAQARLDQALDNMKDALALYDSNGIVLFCNAQYRQLFPLTAHLRVPGARYEDIVRGSLMLGETPLPTDKTLDAHVLEHLAALHEEADTFIFTLDGRTLSCRTKLLPDGGSLRMLGDVTAQRDFEKNLEQMALHDPLTGLPNRAFFNRELATMLNMAREQDSEVAVMILDLDHFKAVNDSFGHAVGDALLVEVARRIEAATRRGDLAARLGGDEFAILMFAPRGSSAAAGLAARILKNIVKPLTIDNVALLPSGTIGYSIFPHDPSDAEGLLRNADRALYRAKAAGRGTSKVFDPEEFAVLAALAG